MCHTSFNQYLCFIFANKIYWIFLFAKFGFKRDFGLRDFDLRDLVIRDFRLRDFDLRATFLFYEILWKFWYYINLL